MKISAEYPEEYKALRYGIMTKSSNNSVKIEGYKQLITIAARLNWFIIKDILVSEAKASPAVVGAIGKLLLENKTDRALAQVTKVQDDFFANVCMNEIQVKKYDICKNAIEYFNHGAFKELSTVFGRFVRNIQEIEEDLLNTVVVKYFVSSVIIGRLNECYNEISFIQTKYTQYDYHIFLFLLKLIEGNFTAASQHVFQIQSSFSIETTKMITVAELQFYFLVVLTLTFQREWAKNLIIKEEAIICQYNEDKPEFFKLLTTYENCNYQGVITEFEQISGQIESDALLSNNFSKICSLIRSNVLREILSSSTKITFDALKTMLKEENVVKIEAWINDCIEKNNLNACIDEVEKVVYINEKNVFDYNVDACLKMSQKNIVDHLKFLMDNVIFMNIDKVDLIKDQGHIQMKDLSFPEEKMAIHEMEAAEMQMGMRSNMGGGMMAMGGGMGRDIMSIMGMGGGMGGHGGHHGGGHHGGGHHGEGHHGGGRQGGGHQGRPLSDSDSDDHM